MKRCSLNLCNSLRRGDGPLSFNIETNPQQNHFSKKDKMIYNIPQCVLCPEPAILRNRWIVLFWADLSSTYGMLFLNSIFCINLQAKSTCEFLWIFALQKAPLWVAPHLLPLKGHYNGESKLQPLSLLISTKTLPAWHKTELCFFKGTAESYILLNEIAPVLMAGEGRASPPLPAPVH